jgi:23S rRNA pseudouridine1911/1915/1917 synthase
MPSTTTNLAADHAGERLDVFVSRRLDGVTRARVQKLINEGLVLVSGAAQRASYRLSAGERVSVTVPEAREASAQAESIALDVIYEDADIIAINKPAGMTVHPAPGHPSSTLVRLETA